MTRDAFNVTIAPAAIDDKPVLANMMQLYLYDFSIYTHDDLNPHGLYNHSYFEQYWQQDDRFPFLIYANDKLAGFILVSTYMVLPGEGYEIAEFFVMQKYRRSGIGRQAAFHVFDAFRGKWEIKEMQNNLPAQAFWRTIIREYISDQFQEVFMDNEEWEGPIQVFNNLARRK